MKKIFLLDNFDSFTFNLVDYFRRLGCEVFVYRNNVDPAKVEEIDPDLIVFSPGPSVPKNAGNMMKIIDLYHQRYPMFGVCLGHEALIEYFGGSLKFVKPVHGKSSDIHHDGKSVFRRIDQDFRAGRYHSLCADEVPDCFEVSAECENLVMAVRHKDLPIEGVQFHPESVLTMKGENGFKMIENLVKDPVTKFLEDSVAGGISVEEQVEFLENYTPEKVTAEDVKIFVEFMNEQMVARLEMPGAIDVCGTGGSGLSRINTSTIASFILAELGVKVAKHGNKSASGRFGSFDILEGLGVKIDLGPEQLERSFEDHGLAFIYARYFHPVMKHFAEARKKIGKPTIFNILGPLLSPAAPERQIIGTSFAGQKKLIAEACKLLGKKRVMVVRGEDGLDEVTLTGKTEVVELRDGEFSEYTLEPSDFGIEKASFEEIGGGECEFNKKVALEILKGNCKTRHADLVYMNCALALKLVGIEDDLKKGFEMAKNVCGIDKLEVCRGNILREIASTKLLRKSDRDFRSAISSEGISLIAEIKKESPSEGEIFTGNFRPGEIAQIYEKNGAAAISVLTDEKYFGGSFEFLKDVRNATESVPILCKDFIVSEHQIFKAREFGADAILLIASLLSVEQIEKFLKVADNLSMDCLVEVHNEEELEKVLKTSAQIIGINNRNLRTFEIDLSITEKLQKLIPDDRIVVSESGIKSAADIPKGVDAILVGTAIMKSKNIKEKMYELT